MAFESQSWNNLYDRDNREDFRLAYSTSQNLFPSLAGKIPFRNNLTFDYDRWVSGDTPLIKDLLATEFWFFTMIQLWVERFQNYFSPGATYNLRWKWFCVQAGLGDATEWGFRYAKTLDGGGVPDLKRSSSRRVALRGDYIGPWLLEDLVIGLEGLTDLNWSNSLSFSMSLEPTIDSADTEPSLASLSDSVSDSVSAPPTFPSAGGSFSVSGPPSIPVS